MTQLPTPLQNPIIIQWAFRSLQKHVILMLHQFTSPPSTTIQQSLLQLLCCTTHARGMCRQPNPFPCEQPADGDQGVWQFYSCKEGLEYLHPFLSTPFSCHFSKRSRRRTQFLISPISLAMDTRKSRGRNLEFSAGSRNSSFLFNLAMRKSLTVDGYCGSLRREQGEINDSCQ